MGNNYQYQFDVGVIEMFKQGEKMENYYDLFVQLSLQQCLKNDYGDKKKVKAHNKASKKLRQLQAEMKTNDCTDVLFNLLDYSDDRVRVNAA